MTHFTGSLETDSPNCLKLIKDQFGAACVNQICQHYSELFSTSLIVEPLTKRSAGARYNPRPARLVHILITEANCQDFETIKTAFDLSFKPDSLIINNLKAPVDLNINLLFMANLLDEIRHMHMHYGLKQQTINDLFEFVSNLDLSKMPNQRLYTLIKASIERLVRFKA